MNVIFTPATAKRYSHNFLSPVFLQRVPGRISAEKGTHCVEFGAQFKRA